MNLPLAFLFFCIWFFDPNMTCGDRFHFRLVVSLSFSLDLSLQNCSHSRDENDDDTSTNEKNFLWIEFSSIGVKNFLPKFKLLISLSSLLRPLVIHLSKSGSLSLSLFLIRYTFDFSSFSVKLWANCNSVFERRSLFEYSRQTHKSANDVCNARERFWLLSWNSIVWWTVTNRFRFNYTQRK